MRTSPIKIKAMRKHEIRKERKEKKNIRQTNLYFVLVPAPFHDLDQICDLHTCLSVF